MNQEKATVTHNGIEIIYDEEADQWLFELRGSSRHAGTLKLAKAAIDRPAPAKKRPFEKVEAYVRPRFRSDELVRATVTGYAGRRYGTDHLWVSIPGGGNSRPDREQVSIAMLYVVNAANTERLSRMEAIDKEIDRLHQERAEILGQMEPFKIADDIERPED